jgi:predicted Fe-S protein YdhL (DUF1289 family)
MSQDEEVVLLPVALKWKKMKNDSKRHLKTNLRKQVKRKRKNKVLHYALLNL